MSRKTPIITLNMPVQYDEACKLLAECRTINETKYWADKAEALAAWSKIYHSHKAAVEARRLKLHAHRRMGILAQEIRPRKPTQGRGSSQGPVSLLVEHGFSSKAAADMTALGRMPEKTFENAVSQPRPPSPSTLIRGERRKINKYYDDLMRVVGITRRYSALEAYTNLANGGKVVKRAVTEVVEWFDELERRLK